MAEPLLATENLVKSFGGVVATDHLSLSIAAGELHAGIGPNGAGKTTRVAQLAGEIAPSSGRIRFAGADITALAVPARSQRGLARSFQIASLCREFTALDNVALAAQAHSGHSFRFWRAARRDEALRAPARAILEQRQLELAIALATRPRLLLLDEPMAGMGQADSATMIALLHALKRRHTILLVEHDMDAVFALADRISVLVYGRCIASGAPDEIRANAAVRDAYLGEEAL
jgi:branched-chain amino acid transport system ATP-binding protein